MSNEPHASPVGILVVDDRPQNRLALRAILARPDYEIVEAESGAAALLLLLRRQFAVLLLDVLMPGMSGLELAATIRARPQTAAVPILFLTAEATDLEQVYRAYDLGAVDYLIKPLVPAVVRAKVGTFVELHRQRLRVEAQAALLVDAARKETELELLQLRLATERRFRSLADAIPHIVFTACPEGTVDYFNRRWFEYTGISAESAAGSWSGAVHPGDREASLAVWKRGLAGVEPVEFQCRLYGAADHLHRWHLCRVVPQRDPGDRIAGWLGTFTDIEEQRRERAVLAEFKGTLDAVQDVVLIFDPATLQILYASQGASDILGHSRAALLHMSPRDIMPEFDEHNLHDLFAAGPLAPDSLTRLQTRYRRSDGSDIPIEISLQRIEINGGRIVSIGRDIRERLRAEAERQHLYDQAVSAVRLRDDFLSIASHELRTPLGALRLHIESLMRKLRRDAPQPEPSDSTPEKLEQAVRQVDRLARLVDDLLDVSRMTTGRLRIEPESVDLVALVRDILGRFESEALRRGCPVELSATCDLRGRWDPVRLEQMFVNLLSNAFKFGAGEPIEVRVWGDATSVFLSVRDHGIGIAPEARERIFQRYERAVPDSHSRGFGLGLYIVERVVAAHGGTISVDSEPGAGSTFTVVLPRSGPASSDDSPDR
ncbi:hybrid sensor histidine kinase/response regulator [Nannocystis pusilla]|uniref:histidine kinase n=1 Tax=Nannocystis pusilla TaxID=889268 RepID=A0ABS7TNY0_9BACT|nr:response regulator [Nannocystis pusilla]